MKTSFAKREDKKVHDLAREYRSQGYEVVLQPKGNRWSNILGNFVPDLIAHRGEEHIIIEVKSRDTISNSERLAEVAQRIEGLPGWSLELVVTNPQSSKTFDGSSLDPYSLKKRLAEANKLLSKNSYEAALVLGWSAAEAALRVMAKNEKVSSRPGNARHLLKFLYTRGLFAERDFELLDSAYLKRSEIVHGFEVKTAKNVVRSFLDAVSRLVGRIE